MTDRSNSGESPESLSETVMPTARRGRKWAYRDRRFGFDEEVSLIEPALDPPLRAVARRLGEDGVWLETDRVLRVDTPVLLELPLLDGPLVVTGIIVTVLRRGPQVAMPGLGVRFDELESEARSSLLATLATLEEEEPDSEHSQELDYTFSDMS